MGSIHMGTVDMAAPLPTRLIMRLKQADPLIVKFDITGSASPFRDAKQKPWLEQRLSTDEFRQLLMLCQELEAYVHAFLTLQGWQVALMMPAR
ncbi:MAG: hypothetical protein G5663_05680 [Serratia symbiotica]|nr:hypothetical protein [Serratia symbiotica]